MKELDFLEDFDTLSFSRDLSNRLLRLDAFTDMVDDYEDEEHLKTSILLQVCEMLPLGMIITDKEGKAFVWNKEATRIMGEKPSQKKGEYKKKFKLLEFGTRKEISPEDFPLSKAFRGESTNLSKFIWVNAPERKERVMLLSAHPIYLHNDEIVGAVGFFIEQARHSRICNIDCPIRRKYEVNDE